MSQKKYLDDNGLLYLWGKLKAAFLSTVTYDTVAKKLKVTKNGVTTDVVTASDIVSDGGGIKDISGKADKVSGGTENNFVALDANGNIKDSGHKSSDFQTPQTTLAGYGITDAYTKGEVDSRISSTYKPAGSAASVAALGSLTAENEGKVYDMSASFTTTADFKDYASQGPKTFPAGTQVAIINTGTSQNPVYKYDTLSGFVDLSAYQKSEDLQAITNGEIDTIVAS